MSSYASQVQTTTTKTNNVADNAEIDLQDSLLTELENLEFRDRNELTFVHTDPGLISLAEKVLDQNSQTMTDSFQTVKESNQSALALAGSVSTSESEAVLNNLVKYGALAAAALGIGIIFLSKK